jgi:hypothetical protein
VRARALARRTGAGGSAPVGRVEEVEQRPESAAEKETQPACGRRWLEPMARACWDRDQRARARRASGWVGAHHVERI